MLSEGHFQDKLEGEKNAGKRCVKYDRALRNRKDSSLQTKLPPLSGAAGERQGCHSLQRAEGKFKSFRQLLRETTTRTILILKLN